MDDVRKMYKYPLNGSGVKVQMIGTTEEGTTAACVTLQLSAWVRPKRVMTSGTQINLYVEAHYVGMNKADDKEHDRYFYIVPTGATIPETALDYIDTCTDMNGLVWHCYEGVEPK